MRPIRKPDEPCAYYYRQGQRGIGNGHHRRQASIPEAPWAVPYLSGFDSNVKEAIEKDIYGAP